MATISVIVPNYRHAAFLPRRIESILGQTRADFELLILDDFSPDDSRAVIARYTDDPRVRTSFNDRNSGNTFLQWRKGLAETTGDYVWIAESDDAADPTLLEKLAAQLDAHPNVGLAVAASSTIDAADRVTAVDYFEGWRRNGTSTYDLDLFRHDFVMHGQDYLRDYMAPWNTLPNASAILFRRSVFDAIGGVSGDLRIAGDWMTYARILARFDIAWVAEPLNLFRQHKDTVGNSLKGVPLAMEGLTVERFIAGVVGRPGHEARRRGTDFKAQIMMFADRRTSDGKIPFSRMPAVLARAAKANRAVLTRTAMILLREGASMLLKGRR